MVKDLSGKGSSGESTDSGGRPSEPGIPDPERLIRWVAAQSPTVQEDPSPCPDASALADLQNGKVGDTERERLEDHLGHCTLCLDHLLVGNQRLPVLEPGRIDRIVIQTASPQAGSVRRGAPWWQTGWMTASVAAVLLAFWFYPAGGPGPALPLFRAELAGQVQTYRGEAPSSDALPVYYPESMLLIRLAPIQGRLPESPVTSVYLETTGTFQPVTGDWTVDFDPATGLIEWRAPAHDILRSDFGRHRIGVQLLPSGSPSRTPWPPSPPGGTENLFIFDLEYKEMP